MAKGTSSGSLLVPWPEKMEQTWTDIHWHWSCWCKSWIYLWHRFTCFFTLGRSSEKIHHVQWTTPPFLWPYSIAISVIGNLLVNVGWWIDRPQGLWYGHPWRGTTWRVSPYRCARCEDPIWVLGFDRSSCSRSHVFHLHIMKTAESSRIT